MKKKLIKPTPGEWEVDGPFDYGRFTIIGDKLLIADVNGGLISGKANAKMMAASKELYENLYNAYLILKIKTPKEDEITWLQIDKMKKAIEAAELWVDE